MVVSKAMAWHKSCGSERVEQKRERCICPRGVEKCLAWSCSAVPNQLKLGRHRVLCWQRKRPAAKGLLDWRVHMRHAGACGGCQIN